MKVLHVYKTYYPASYGGAEHAIKQIVHSTQKFGISSKVFCLSKEPSIKHIQESGYEIIHFPLNFEIASTGFSLKALINFKKYASEADIIHYHFPWPFADLMHFITRPKKPSIVTYQSDIIRQKRLLQIYKPLMHWFLRKMKAIVATSPNYFATSSILQTYREKVSIIPIGIDEQLYPNPTEEKLNDWKNKIGNDFFLFVGVLRYYKGLHILLDACQNKDFKVVILGGGPIEAELKQHALRLGLKNVYFLGPQEEMDKVALFKLCRAVVFPSHLRSEAFGVSLLEGAMFGKPLISSEIGTGCSYINIHQETGLVVPPSDPKAFAEAMQFMVDNPDATKAMGQRAYSRYLELFNSEKMGQEYSNLYKMLVEK